MRSRFDEQLALLNRELIEMGALCEEVIALAARALTEDERELAAKVAPLDERDRPEGARHRVALPEAAAAAAAGCARPAPDLRRR